MKNEYTSTQKFLLGSPRKLRQVVMLVKKLTPLAAIEKLPFVSRRSARDLNKVIMSAVANARQAGVVDTDLVFKEIQIGEGPRLKRGTAASRGRWHPVIKAMSHIRVVLTTSKGQEVKVEKKQVKTEVVKQEKKEIKASGPKSLRPGGAKIVKKGGSKE